MYVDMQFFPKPFAEDTSSNVIALLFSSGIGEMVGAHSM
jgi:hypothetical protein